MSHSLRACNGFYLNIVSVFKVRDEETPVPFMLDDLDIWKLIHFKFLIFWGMGIIESPLLERDISADKVLSASSFAGKDIEL